MVAQDQHHEGEAGIVARTSTPVTAGDVASALEAVGVGERGGGGHGEVVIVHSSLSRLGWVVGGAHSVVVGLLAAVGGGGTIVMPAQTGISDPSTWQNPPVEEPRSSATRPDSIYGARRASSGSADSMSQLRATGS